MTDDTRDDSPRKRRKPVRRRVPGKLPPEERRRRLGKAKRSPAQIAHAKAIQPKAVATALATGAHTGPKTDAGKAASSRNNWKHGRFSVINRAHFGVGATSIGKLFGKPCLTTCPWHPDNPDRTDHPCSLVLDGLTRAGSNCLDKTVYVNALSALMEAMDAGEMDGMHGVLANELASNLQIIDAIRQAIADHGILSPRYAVSREGKVIMDPENPGLKLVTEYKTNPALSALIAMTDAIKINFPELLATPRARQTLNDQDDAANTFTTLLGRVMASGAGLLNRPKPRTLTHKAEE